MHNPPFESGVRVAIVWRLEYLFAVYGNRPWAVDGGDGADRGDARLLLVNKYGREHHSKALKICQGYHRIY